MKRVMEIVKMTNILNTLTNFGLSLYDANLYLHKLIDRYGYAKALRMIRRGY